MTWIKIDTASDLELLNQSNCWDDSTTLKFYASNKDYDYFPPDRAAVGGFFSFNIHLLLEACSADKPILELVFIGADWTNLQYLSSPHFFNSRIDKLKRVYIESSNGDTEMRCSRLIYRYMEENEIHFSSRHFLVT
ncbi:hypothetical protein E9531_10560 [Lampropedia puyangensis]|uniref:Uncharacterized protein n=1 Tax=Lampropedia puyangensis TaxID=1330072 RepID=A0A4S8EZV9_9BURK|nr:hypothetical protein [Lampropedia puyangensis]THU00207.1 hypothetical protein E9531_10560 [Lampropedia puyangensis]